MLYWSKKLYADIISTILRHIDDWQRPGHTPQPIFIVGSAGSGKSTIMRLLVDALNARGISDGIQFLDGKRFFNSHDIIHAMDSEDGDTCDVPISENGDEERRIVMIDDLDYFFKRTTFDTQYLLRNYLNRESAPLLIASISGIDKSLADYRAPFFEGVRLIFIPPLDTSVISMLDLTAEKQKRINVLLDYLPDVIASLDKAWRIVALSDNADTDLPELLDQTAPSFRIKLEQLPVYSQKILCAIAASESAVTLAELRELTGLPGGILSTYLRKMMKSGDIRKTASSKRGSPYEISDRLFKLWLSSPSNSSQPPLSDR